MLGTVDCSEASDFNPRSPYGERQIGGQWRTARHHFNPRSPYGERLLSLLGMIYPLTFQSTLPLRGATCPVFLAPFPDWISIHAPLTGSDNIPPHSLLLIDISIHAPLTGSDNITLRYSDNADISIHAPLTGSDINATIITSNNTDFNPRSPYGERHWIVFSIFSISYFNPRSPYGERPSSTIATPPSYEFQSTLPLRGATPENTDTAAQEQISIHAPLTGSDCSC